MPCFITTNEFETDLCFQLFTLCTENILSDANQSKLRKIENIPLLQDPNGKHINKEVCILHVT